MTFKFTLEFSKSFNFLREDIYTKKKKKEHTKRIYIIFVDYTKIFDVVSKKSTWGSPDKTRSSRTDVKFSHLPGEDEDFSEINRFFSCFK